MSAREDDGVKWAWADIRDMPQHSSKSIDVAFDKGTMDAMIHGSPWSPPDDVKDNTSRYLAEVGDTSACAESMLIKGRLIAC